MNLTSEKPNARNQASPTGSHWALPTMVEVAQWRASQHGTKPAYTYLLDGADKTAGFTYAELDARARAIAAQIQRSGPRGQRVLVVLEPGLDYIATLFGCFYAGAIAVPVYPPDPFRLARTLPRLQAISQNAECNLLASSTELLGGERSALKQIGPAQTLAIDAVADDAANDYQKVGARQNDVALLQYTSGTTGTPRGVAITHANLQYNMRAMEQVLDVPDAVVMLWLPPYHDLGLIGGVFLPLFAGRRVVLMSPLDFVRHPASWLHAMSRYRATTSAAPNFGYELCTRKVTEEDCEGLDLSNWRVAVSGAEPVRSDTLDRFSDRFSEYGFRRESFVPAYGMAEATLMISVSRLNQAPVECDYKTDELSKSIVTEVNGSGAASRRLVGCGPPGPEVEVRIVDPKTRRPVRGVGEVWVRTPGVASGYWGDKHATEASFDAVTTTGESGFLRTGDLGFLDQGELFIVGRLKETLILGGRNFYPQDIELAIQARDPAFKTDGGAVASVEVDNEERLVVFQEVSRPKRQDLDKLLAVARETVVEETLHEPYAVVLTPVGDIPKTSSGKTRRADCWREFQAGAITAVRAWCAGDIQRGDETTRDTTPPHTATEKWLADCWRQILDVERVYREDSFIQLGGQSLQLVEMLQQVAERTGGTLSVKSLFERPMLHQIAEWIDQQPAYSQAQSAPSASDDFLAVSQPLSEPQQRMWMLEQLGLPGGANVPLALKLDGPLDLVRLQTALDALVARHQVLRTGFAFESGEPRQRLHDALSLSMEELTGDCGDDPIAWALDQPFTWRPFNLAAPPLARAGVVEAQDGSHVVLLVLHHLICDGASFEPLVRDLATLYAGEELAPPAADYWDYLSLAESESPGSDRTAYWRERLSGMPPAINLPLASDPPAADPRDIQTRHATVSKCLAAAINEFAAERGVTPFMVYLSAYQMLLARYSGDERFVVGVAEAGRDHPAWRSTVGCFMDAAPLAARLTGDETYEQFLGRLRGEVLADLEQTGLAWDDLMEAADAQRVAGRMPLAQAFFLYETPPAAGLGFGDARLNAAATDYRGLGVYDLTLVVDAGQHGSQLRLVHDPARLSSPIVERMADSYIELLRRVINTPKQTVAELNAVGKQEYARLARLASGRVNAPEAPQALELLRQQVAAHPDRVAIECGATTLTYGQLGCDATKLAMGLLQVGIEQGDRVGLMTHRSSDMLTAMLALWMCGAAYVPLDPAYPQSRLDHMIDDCRPAALLVDDALAGHAPKSDAKLIALQALIADSSNLQGDLPKLSGDPIAYVIYTSGSTGKPKGVVVAHAALANFLRSFADDLEVTPEDRVLAATTVSFDISALELFLPLTVGAAVVMADSDTVGDGARLAKLIDKSDVTLVQGTPSTFRMLLAAGWQPSESIRVVAGGEELTPDVAKQLLGAARLWNVYGPTETTIWSTIDEVSKADRRISIGRPIDNTTCYVLGADRTLVPEGAWGELAIGGRGLAEGYFEQPELTSERFPTVTLPGGQTERLYRTGDRVRWRADGRLEFGGRVDNQVKVRGHRIELGEIELALLNHPAVAEAAVIVAEDPMGASLAAYVVAAAGETANPADLRAHLADSLPEYMIPAAFVAMDGALPRTGSGKIDRGRLPKAEGCRLARSAERVAPRTPIEERLAEWWCEVLRLEEVSVFDNFFELGGHSLSVMQLVVRVRDNLGVELPLREAYAAPTIAQWAEMILAAQLASGESLDKDLIDQLEGLTDEQAIALLESMQDD